MYFEALHADRGTQDPLSQDFVLNAINNSPDGGSTIVLSKLDLTEVPIDSVKQLARVKKGKSDDECIVERITLGNNRLSTLPTEFTFITRLRYLNLKHNSFSRFPDVITILPVLDTLDISHNKITNFPQTPGQLVNLRVFSFSRNKITQLPPYFPHFHNLELLRLDRNPIEWPPQSVLDAGTHEDDKDMKSWIHHIQDWIDYNVSASAYQDDSGYGEIMEFEQASVQDKSNTWKFPNREILPSTQSPWHTRSFSVDSTSSIVSGSFLQTEASVDADWKSSILPSPAGITDSPIPQHENDRGSSTEHLDNLMVRPTSVQTELSDSDYDAQLHLHIRTSSVTDQRQPFNYVPAKQSLPDLRSSSWKEEPTYAYNFVDTQLKPSISRNSAASMDTQSDSTLTRGTPSMAFQRNSYFQRLTTMPQSIQLPQPLLCLVETARSILFVTSQIYQTVEHYANHAIDEKDAFVFKKVLEPANADMLQLINSLERYDTSTRKGLPSGPVCRALLESCRNTIAVTHKAVGLFGIQLRIAPCEDFRYSRWILLELYASTVEISVAWQNLLPHSEALKVFLNGKPGSAFLAAMSESFQPSRRNDGLSPAPRLRNTDFSSVRTHNARRHAGSFSHRDVEIGKELPNNYDEPVPRLVVQTSASTLRIPKRQVTAPPAVPSLPIKLALPAFSSSSIPEEDSPSGHHFRIDDTQDPPPLSVGQTSNSRSQDFAGEIRHRVDSHAIRVMLESLDSTQNLWITVEESLAPLDPSTRELVSRGRDIGKKIVLTLRDAIENSRGVNQQSVDSMQLFIKVLNQLYVILKGSSRSRPTLPSIRSTIGRVIESLEEFVKLLHLPVGMSRSYSETPSFSNPFGPMAPMDDNRLASSLSRTRSAQPSPKPSWSIGSEEYPRSGFSTTSGLRLPSTGYLPGREPWTESPDPV
ncbi:hypothetical protein FA15DRAFT_180243 [Coprinopsis marcescibilis]|uniref:L domain-like protein n=1 Tax=Coprinopsis marcescibilis TaxID=230819 RepID=A0A5C3LB29_COPMA|nr:hypothetical protein FA15DRAFT_180243 [Coprinopsis marcescibilis]